MTDYANSAGFDLPNYTQVPNVLFDVLMQNMGEAELKVTLCIIRKIIGYHKFKPEAVSLTQIQQMTGLSRQGAIDGLNAAIKRGTIKKAGEGKRGVALYQVVHTDDQSTKETTTGQDSRPVTSQDSRHTKEKEKKESKENLSIENPAFEEMLGTVKKELKQYGNTAKKIAGLLTASLTSKDAELNLEKPMSVAQFKAFLLDWDKKTDREGKKLHRPKNIGSVKSNVEAWLDSLNQPPQVVRFTPPKQHISPRPASVVIPAQTTVSDSQQADALAILQAARGGLAHVSA